MQKNKFLIRLIFEWVKMSAFHAADELQKRDQMKNLTGKTKKRKFQKLMREIRENPNVGLEKFYNTYGKIVQITARTICRSLEQADVVVNMVLVKVWQLSKEDVVIDNPEGWVYIITANTAKDALREKTFFPLHEAVADQKDEIQDLIDKDAFYSMIKGLSEKEQGLMIDKFIKKLTFREIAEEKGENINTVSAVYYRALKKVKKYLEEQNERHGH